MFFFLKTLLAFEAGAFAFFQEQRLDTTRNGDRLRPRDPRIDFFRGAALLIIFVSHMPFNVWSNFLPTRFVFCDAADVFVFCSGLASGLAYGGAYQRSGFLPGTARVALRCWQVYFAHICLFVFCAALLVGADRVFGHLDVYVAQLNLKPFFHGDTKANLLGLLTLTYVPNLFDILPLYVVLLAMIPVAVALARWFGPLAPITASVALWFVATNGYLQFPAEPWSDRNWHFHPLAWQVLFFAGFAFTRGWIRVPPVNRHLLVGCVAVTILLAPIAYWPLAENVPALKAAHQWIGQWANKTTFGVVRALQFGCVAYAAYVLSGPAGQRLKGPIVDVAVTLGRHSLAVFLVGVIVSLVGGIVLFETTFHPLAYVAVNLLGACVVIGTAYFVSWMKGAPWKRAKPEVEEDHPITITSPVRQA